MPVLSDSLSFDVSSAESSEDASSLSSDISSIDSSVSVSSSELRFNCALLLP